MADARNFLLNSDYPVDKIAYLYEGSYTVTTSAGDKQTIAHGLPFTPLVHGGWSTTSNFSTTYTFGTGSIPTSDPTVAIYDIIVSVAADDTNIYILPFNVSGGSQLIYYRVHGFEPSDSTENVDLTINAEDNLQLSTDYNYTKLLENGTFATSPPDTTTVTHSLGYVPQVSTWVKESFYFFTPFNNIADVTHPAYGVSITSGSVSGGLGVVPTTTNVSFETPSGSNIENVHYRIYADENN